MIGEIKREFSKAKGEELQLSNGSVSANTLQTLGPTHSYHSSTTSMRGVGLGAFRGDHTGAPAR
eukprot:20964-Heterococcus_DN1.PRE.3